MEIRLDKLISDQKNLPRKECRKLIFKGAVSVDGLIEKSPDKKVDPERVKICLFDEEIEYRKYVYIMLNKPKGVLSAATDKNRKTVVDLVPENIKHKNLFPVGRLDRDTKGLILITDDGDFAHKVISPKSGILKRYEVVLDGEIPERAVEEFLSGITLQDGTECLPAKLILDPQNKNMCQIEIMEGKYHQVKRMFGVIGLGVNELKRLSIGELTLGDLEEGECKLLSAEELDKIRKGNKNN